MCIYRYYIYICSMISKDLLKGTLKTIVLKLLEENKRMYGYEITKEVERLSRGSITLTWGGLYPLLHKLEKEGLIIAEKESIGKRVRKYYSLTPSGSKTAKEKVQEFLDFVSIVGNIINPQASLNLS